MTNRSAPRRTQGRPRPEDVAGLAERRAAAKAVAATFERERMLDEAVRDAGEHPLARAIAVTTFRRFGTIQGALDERLAKGLPRDVGILAILATGAAQILFLDVPDHAAVDLSVRLAQEGQRTRHLSGMVNAVLRRIAREREAILSVSDPEAEVPSWLVERWHAAWGAERTAAMAAAHLNGPALDLSFRSDPTEWIAAHGGILLPTGSVRITDRRSPSELPGYAEGEFWVQDAAAAIPARLLHAKPGERIVDLCAAPGGKTAQLAAAGARVTAVDRSEPRLERLGRNLHRLGLEADIQCVDALAFQDEPFDAVLLDAPCTATGTLRRHPDIGWTRTDGDIVHLAGKQAALLDRAADLVRPGGRLVYCVCSLEPEEGERQADAFLKRRPGFTRRPITAGEAGLEAGLLTKEGDLRTTPDQWAQPPAGVKAGVEGWRSGLDGFYAVRLVRTA